MPGGDGAVAGGAGNRLREHRPPAALLRALRRLPRGRSVSTRARRLKPAAALLLAAAIALAGCGRVGGGGGGRVQVVAAENFWGSIARQLGGNRAHVTSLV